MQTLKQLTQAAIAAYGGQRQLAAAIAAALGKNPQSQYRQLSRWQEDRSSKDPLVSLLEALAAAGSTVTLTVKHPEIADANDPTDIDK